MQPFPYGVAISLGWLAFHRPTVSHRYRTSENKTYCSKEMAKNALRMRVAFSLLLIMGSHHWGGMCSGAVGHVTQSYSSRMEKLTEVGTLATPLWWVWEGLPSPLSVPNHFHCRFPTISTVNSQPSQPSPLSIPNHLHCWFPSISTVDSQPSPLWIPNHLHCGFPTVPTVSSPTLSTVNFQPSPLWIPNQAWSLINHSYRSLTPSPCLMS